MNTTRSEAEIAAGVQALDAYLASNRPHLMRILSGDVANCQCREDVLQEAALRALSAIHRGLYDPKRSFSAWFYRVLKNVMHSRQRAERRARRNVRTISLDGMNLDRELGGDDLCLATIISQIDETSERTRLQDAIATLKADERDMVRTLVEQDCTAKELAEEIGKSHNTVRQRLWRIQRQLAAQVAE